jgi:hypothetical protein
MDEVKKMPKIFSFPTVSIKSTAHFRETIPLKFSDAAFLQYSVF